MQITVSFSDKNGFFVQAVSENVDDIKNLLSKFNPMVHPSPYDGPIVGIGTLPMPIPATMDSGELIEKTKSTEARKTVEKPAVEEPSIKQEVERSITIESAPVESYSDEQVIDEVKKTLGGKSNEGFGARRAKVVAALESADATRGSEVKAEDRAGFVAKLKEIRGE